MEFFDEAVFVVKDAFGKVCQKTEEVVSVQKMKLNIASLENKQAKDFEALGRYCFESVMASTDADEPAKAIAEEIAARAEEIRKAKIKLCEAEGKTVCKQCGRKVARDAKFCSECGANL